jgi:hypothetical protein
MSAELRPIFQKRAALFVDEHHRHNPAPRGWLFGTSLFIDGTLRAVAYAGRPNAPALQDGVTVEVTRVCTLGDRNACSRLYGACCRAAAALGYRRAVTYTLASESGASVRAAGFGKPTPVDEREWDRPKRRRVTRHTIAPRVRWERAL